LVGFWVTAGLIQTLPPWRKALTLLGRAWARFKVISRIIGNFQSRVLLTLFYFLILAPFGLAVRMFRDPLGLKPRQGSHWFQRASAAPASFEGARRQS
jgi:hypothetical protein